MKLLFQNRYIGVVKAKDEWLKHHLLRYPHELTFCYGLFGYQIYLRPMMQKVLTFPERMWRRALCYFWIDRLTFQYERGYADGVREALANYQNYASLTPQELEAVLAQPASQQGF